MTHADYFMLALCLWREARGEGHIGMLAVGCVIRNRVGQRSTSFYVEVVRAQQFSSITGKGDPELTLFPTVNDPAWGDAQSIAADVIEGRAQDLTGGSTLYYNPNAIDSNVLIGTPTGAIKFPATWNKAKVRWFGQIGKHVFFVEIA